MLLHFVVKNNHTSHNWTTRDTAVSCVMQQPLSSDSCSSVNVWRGDATTSGTVDTPGKAQQKHWNCHCHMLCMLTIWELKLLEMVQVQIWPFYGLPLSMSARKTKTGDLTSFQFGCCWNFSLSSTWHWHWFRRIVYIIHESWGLQSIQANWVPPYLESIQSANLYELWCFTVRKSLCVFYFEMQKGHRV